MSSSAVSIRRNLLDILHGFALPMIAFALPWRWAFATYRALAHLPLYSTRVAMMLEGIGRTRRLDAEEARRLSWRHRLYLLLEAGDAALAQTRGSAWMRRHLRRVGDFPLGPEGYVGIFFHYGTGFWGMRAMAEHGRVVRLLGRTIDRGALRHRPFLLRHGEWRYAVAEKVGRGPMIMSGGARRQIAEALATGQALLGMVDVPPGETHTLSPVTLLGHPTHFSRGMVEMAAQSGVPLVVLSVGLSANARERVLEVSKPIVAAGRPTQHVMQELASHLDRHLARDPAGWYLWGWLDAFFAPGTFVDPDNSATAGPEPTVDDADEKAEAAIEREDSTL